MLAEKGVKNRREMMINLQKLLKQICFLCISDTESERTTGINSLDTIKGNKDPG